MKKALNGELVDLTTEEESAVLFARSEEAVNSVVRTRQKMNVTRFQALAALDQTGLLPQVEAIMADPQTPNITKLAWNNALEFKRLSPTVVALGATLGLTDEQLDTLFTQAKSIEA